MLTHLLDAKGLRDAAKRLRTTPLGDLVRQPGRASRLRTVAGDLSFDYSRHLIDEDVLDALLAIALEQGFVERRRALFAGDAVNHTEGRSALHTALRSSPDTMPESVREVINACRSKMIRLATLLIDGVTTGHTGRQFTDVISIGIGGSDLGPRMAATALGHQGTALRVHFVSNVDPADIRRALANCQPETTLVIVSSKTFTTQETLLNAKVARHWIVSALGEHAVARHVFAVTTAVDKAVAFGVMPDHVLPMWDWVGGRYSVWSAIGFPLMLAIGPSAFEDFLAGAALIDEHFMGAEPAANMPLIMAALTVWYRNLLGAETHGVIAYEQRLELFVDHLQQLDMESLGKCVRRDGTAVDHETGCVIWGGVGTNTQHSFHQLLHQGTSLHPVDFMVGLSSDCDTDGQHAVLFANCLAQSAALLDGRPMTSNTEPVDPHRVIPGGRPHSLIVYPRLTPGILGQLVAVYEHKVFAQAVFWDINPFDQFGVELGKTIGLRVLGALTMPEDAWERDAGTALADFDPAMQELIRRYRAQKA